MAKVYLHPSVELRLAQLVKDLPQSLVLTGAEGIGLKMVAEKISKDFKATLITVLPEKDEKVDLEKGVITVDVIRRLYNTTKTIETGRRIIVIDYVERMGVQAQNAFLKLLEEPGQNTHFILLTHSLSSLLPTIRSRVQLIEVKPINEAQSAELLNDLKVVDAQKKAQLLFIAKGLPALMTTLAGDEGAFTARAQVIRDARTYLQGTQYDRLKISLGYKDSRQNALTLLVDAMNLLKGSINNGQEADVVRKIGALLKAYERIEANGNVRLQLASIML